ncbi:unnamed protein product [Effrenium voratum]|nr:unnamed protein product [Effrenium voratum]
MHTRAGRTSCVSALCQPAGHHAPPWARTHLDGLALSRKHFWPQVDSCPLWLAPALCWSLPWPWLWPPSVDGALWHPRRTLLRLSPPCQQLLKRPWTCRRHWAAVSADGQTSNSKVDLGSSLNLSATVEALMLGIVLGTVPITMLGLFVSAWLQFKKGPTLGI